MITITVTDVIRSMYRTCRGMSGDNPWDMVGEVYFTTREKLLDARLPRTPDHVGKLAEDVIAAIYAAAGVSDNGSDETPECMATVEQARAVMASAADVSDILTPGRPVDDERRLAHLVETVPDVD